MRGDFEGTLSFLHCQSSWAIADGSLCLSRFHGFDSFDRLIEHMKTCPFRQQMGPMLVQLDRATSSKIEDDDDDEEEDEQVKEEVA